MIFLNRFSSWEIWSSRWTGERSRAWRAELDMTRHFCISCLFPVEVTQLFFVCDFYCLSLLGKKSLSSRSMKSSDIWGTVILLSVSGVLVCHRLCFLDAESAPWCDAVMNVHLILFHDLLSQTAGFICDNISGIPIVTSSFWPLTCRKPLLSCDVSSDSVSSHSNSCQWNQTRWSVLTC